MAQAVMVASRISGNDAHNFNFLTTKNIDTRVFAVLGSATCVKVGQKELTILSEPAQPSCGMEPLLRILEHDGKFIVDKVCATRRLWHVVKELPERQHLLVEGDLVKLGRFKFRVHQLALEEDERAVRLDDQKVTQCQALPELHTGTCRICLQEGSSREDPLISPCRCKGSVAQVHFGCLRRWVSSRLNCNDDAGSFVYTPQVCELCQEPLPAFMEQPEVDGAPMRQRLLELPKTKPPFIVLEALEARSDSAQQTRGPLHVVSLANGGDVRLGRSEECNVRVSHSSVSRCHATIKLGTADGQMGFVLEDHQSKFGTLVAVRKRTVLAVDAPFTVQAGNAVLSLTLEASFDPASVGMVPVSASGSIADTSDRARSSSPEDSTNCRVCTDSFSSNEALAGPCRRSSSRDGVV